MLFRSVKGPAVELQPPRGAAQGRPELLVELVQVLEVGAGLEADLVEAAGAEEAPGMWGGHGMRDGGGGRWLNGGGTLARPGFGCQMNERANPLGAAPPALSPRCAYPCRAPPGQGKVKK